MEIVQTGIAIDSPASIGSWAYVLTQQASANSGTGQVRNFRLRAEVRSA